jgi:hypothetical protein
LQRPEALTSFIGPTDDGSPSPSPSPSLSSLPGSRTLQIDSGIAVASHSMRRISRQVMQCLPGTVPWIALAIELIGIMPQLIGPIRPPAGAPPPMPAVIGMRSRHAGPPSHDSRFQTYSHTIRLNTVAAT